MYFLCVYSNKNDGNLRNDVVMKFKNKCRIVLSFPIELEL